MQAPRGGPGIFQSYKDRFQKYSTPAGRVATLDDDVFPPDPKSQDVDTLKQDQLEGFNMQMTQAMNHYQCKEHHCFVCGATDHFARDCLHCQAFCVWHQEHLNSKGMGLNDKAPTPENSQQK